MSKKATTASPAKNPSICLSLIGYNPGLPWENSIRRIAKRVTKSKTKAVLESLRVSLCLTTVDEGCGLWMTAVCYEMGIPFIVINPWHDHISTQKGKGHKARVYMNRARSVIQLKKRYNDPDITKIYLDLSSIGKIAPIDETKTHKFLPFLYRNNWMIERSDNSFLVYTRSGTIYNWTLSKMSDNHPDSMHVDISSYILQEEHKIMMKKTIDEIPF